MKGVTTYVATLVSILAYSMVKRMKTLVWVVIKTLILNVKTPKNLLFRRSRIMAIKKININEVFSYINLVNRYLKLVNVLTNFVKDGIR